jgi:ribonuclease R
MILANEAVAGHLARLRRPALYRVHEPPDPAAVELLVARLADLGVPTVALPEHLATRDAAPLVAEQAARLEAYLRGRGRRGEGLSTLVLRAMSQARYDPRNLGHAGLASPAYCHFTSPIRRYPDLVCQRALCASIGLGHPPAGDLDAVAAHASEAERAAADVERSADDLCLASLLVEREHGHDAGAFPAEVTGLIGAGLFVRFGEVYEGFLPSRRLDVADRFDVNELGTALVGRANGRRYRLAEELEVEVTQVEVPRGRVTLDLVGGTRQRARPPRPRDGQRQRPRPRPGGRRRR